MGSQMPPKHPVLGHRQAFTSPLAPATQFLGFEHLWRRFNIPASPAQLPQGPAPSTPQPRLCLEPAPRNWGEPRQPAVPGEGRENVYGTGGNEGKL